MFELFERIPFLKAKKFWFLLIIFNFFILADGLTTYYGVCVNNGVELNREAIWLSYNFGFIFSAFILRIAIFNLPFLLISYVFPQKINKISALIFKILLIFIFVSFVYVIIFNVSGLFGWQNPILYVGLPIVTQDINILKDLPQIVAEFDREKFCRLF